MKKGYNYYHDYFSMIYDPKREMLYTYSGDLMIDNSSKIENFEMYEENKVIGDFNLVEDKTKQYFVFSNPSSSFVVEKDLKSVIYEEPVFELYKETATSYTVFYGTPPAVQTLNIIDQPDSVTAAVLTDIDCSCPYAYGT